MILYSFKRKTLKISRDEFEESISAKIEQTVMKCNLLLKELKLEARDIDGVILAGGSTRMPCVQKAAEEIFKQEPIPVGNPDEMVALGAALFAAHTSDDALLNSAQKESIENVNIKKRTADYYGTTAITDGELKVVNLIKRGAVLPATHTETFYANNPDKTRIRVTDSRTNEDDPEWVFIKYDGFLKHPGQNIEDPIEVTFGYDTNQVMECSFVHLPSGIKEEVSINFDADQSEEDLEKFLVE